MRISRSSRATTTWRSRCLPLAFMLVVAACGGGDSDDDGAADDTPDTTTATTEAAGEASSSSDRGTCNLVVTGDVQFSTATPGTIPANSDYWLTDAALKSAEQVHDDYDERVAAGQQLLQILQITCGEPEGVLLGTTDYTTRRDVPQGPGTYTVLNYLDKAKPGIAASVVVPGDSVFGVTGGEVTVTRFDDEGVVGSFELQAEEISISVERGAQPKHLSMTGEFDIPCWAVGSPCS